LKTDFIARRNVNVLETFASNVLFVGTLEVNLEISWPWGRSAKNSMFSSLTEAANTCKALVTTHHISLNLQTSKRIPNGHRDLPSFIRFLRLRAENLAPCVAAPVKSSFDMADPATILAIVNGSVGLALKIGTVANKLYTLSQRLTYAELTIQLLASECKTIQAAWDGIEAWVRQQPDHHEEGQQALLDRIKESLLFGTMVLTALEGDLDQFINQPQGSGLLRRNKIVWNEASFKGHQDRIRGQVAAMTLLLQVIKL
jgi:hypothetical protein